MLNSPRAVALDASGSTLFVADSGNHRISKYNASTGAFQGWIGRVNSTAGLGGGAGCSATPTNSPTPAWCTGGTSKSGNGNGHFNTPRGLTVDVTGTNLYVADTTNNRLMKYTISTGAFVGWNGRILTTGGMAGACLAAGVGATTPGWCTGGTAQTGTLNGQFNAPRGLSLDSTGVMLVADSGNHRITVMTASTGVASSSFGSSGNSDGLFNTPSAASADPTRSFIYVADTTNNRVQKFTYSTTTFVGWRGAVSTTPTGGDPGCTTTTAGYYTPGWCTGGTAQAANGNGMYNGPLGISTYSSSVLVGDSGNHRVIRIDQ